MNNWTSLNQAGEFLLRFCAAHRRRSIHYKKKQKKNNNTQTVPDCSVTVNIKITLSTLKARRLHASGGCTAQPRLTVGIWSGRILGYRCFGGFCSIVRRRGLAQRRRLLETVQDKVLILKFWIRLTLDGNLCRVGSISFPRGEKIRQFLHREQKLPSAVDTLWQQDCRTAFMCETQTCFPCRQEGCRQC